jgi:hypothetical protein
VCFGCTRTSGMRRWSMRTPGTVLTARRDSSVTGLVAEHAADLARQLQYQTVEAVTSRTRSRKANDELRQRPAFPPLRGHDLVVVLHWDNRHPAAVDADARYCFNRAAEFKSDLARR